MDRLANINETRVAELLVELERDYPNYAKPCPATTLKSGDDVLWLDVFPIRVLWGHDHPDYFNGYCSEYFGEGACNVEAQWVNDRAPLDPEETPMPIYPVQQLQQQQQHEQAKRSTDDRKRALQHLLKQLSPEHAKKARELVRSKKPELLDDKGKP